MAKSFTSDNLKGLWIRMYFLLTYLERTEVDIIKRIIQISYWKHRNNSGSLLVSSVLRLISRNPTAAPMNKLQKVCYLSALEFKKITNPAHISTCYLQIE